jgi:uncharacterized membrane protein YfcA
MSGWLVAAVGLVALVYSTVGHAGATGYIAVLSLAGVAPEVIRPTALALNVLVASIATVQFGRAGHLRGSLCLPLAAGSVPAAFVGGGLAVPTAVFEAVVGGALVVAAARLVRQPAGSRVPAELPATGRPVSPAALIALGAAIGLLSGLTGVGGGVFLSPVLVALGAAPIHGVAAVSAAFILVNSLAGLAGRFMAGGSWPDTQLPALVAVTLGGAIGSQLGAFGLPVRALRLLMALVLAAAAAKLLVPLAAGLVRARGW